MDVREQVRRAAQQAEDAASLGWAAVNALRGEAPDSKAFGRERARRIAVERQLEEMRRERDEERAMRERSNRELDEARAEQAVAEQIAAFTPKFFPGPRIVEPPKEVLDGLQGKVRRQAAMIKSLDEKVLELKGKLSRQQEVLELKEEEIEKLEQRLAERESRAPDISSVGRDKLLAEIARRLL